MKNYVKPVAFANSDLSEGVFMASGSSDCYTVSATIHQKPELGRGDYRIQVNGVHNALDGHHSGQQVLILSFSLPVTYGSSNGVLLSGDGTTRIEIGYQYHNNAQDNIGLGDVCVTADAGLSVTGAVLTCNKDCGQH